MGVAGNSKSCPLTELGATFISYNMVDCNINGIVFNFTDDDTEIQRN